MDPVGIGIGSVVGFLVVWVLRRLRLGADWGWRAVLVRLEAMMR